VTLLSPIQRSKQACVSAVGVFLTLAISLLACGSLPVQGASGNHSVAPQSKVAELPIGSQAGTALHAQATGKNFGARQEMETR
jgi:hypothetical protein